MFLCVSDLAVGELQKAAGHLEVFQKLAHKHRWHTDSGDSQYEMACEHLRRVYTSIAEKVLALWVQILLCLQHFVLLS